MDNIDNIIRAKLVDHTAEYPDFIWGNIAKEIAQPPKKTGFFSKPIFVILTVLLLGFVSYCGWQMSSANTVASSNSLIESNTPDSQNSNNGNEQLSVLPQEDITTNDINKEDKTEVEILNKTIEEIKLTDTENDNQKFNSSDAESSAKSINSVTNNNQTSITSENKTFVVQDNVTSAKLSTMGNASLADASNEETSPGLKNATLLIENNSSITQNEERLQFGFSVIDNDINHLNRADRAPAVYPYGVTCPSFKESGNLFAVEVYGGIDLPFSPLNVKTGNDLSYQVVRNESESPFISVSTGVRGSFYLTDNLAVRAGLELGIVTQKFEYLDPNSILTETTIRELTDGEGNVIGRDTSYVQVEGARTVRHYNTMTAIGVPIQLGIEKNVGQYILGINGGVMLDLVNFHAAKILDPSIEVVYASSNQNSTYDLYKKDFGLSLKADLSLGWRIRQNSIFLIEPNFKYYLKSVTVDSHPIDQKLFTIGLRTGLRFHF